MERATKRVLVSGPIAFFVLSLFFVPAVQLPRGPVCPGGNSAICSGFQSQAWGSVTFAYLGLGEVKVQWSYSSDPVLSYQNCWMWSNNGGILCDSLIG